MKIDEAHCRLNDALPRLAPALSDRLPPERTLAREIGCSRATLRAALDRLEQAGEIWRHVGQGTFRGPRPRHLPLREALRIEGATPGDLMQARLSFEPSIAALAARNAGTEDLRYLQTKVEAGRRAGDRRACEQADDAFHRAIAQVGGNPVMIGVMEYLSGARRRMAWQRQWDQAYRRLAVDEFQTLHSDQHAEIVAAIAAHAPEAAAARMRDHLQAIARAMGVGAPAACEGL
ncbi:FadR/GntR family transcriptional regulator [Sulfitobacter aestuarii]|uniref:FadR/GntR family transcriptional regulator n=1 Tax=Sulfitobacter aestuarii TaxID=2161676 RepID=A0ABW5TZ20_9RHOB